MSAPIVKGWCPGAYRPMMSGDGLIVRVRPRLGRLTAAKVIGLCDLALTHASGIIDLTNRANMQMRAVRDHQAVLDGLLDLGLLDPTPEIESRRNLIVAPQTLGQHRSDLIGAQLITRLDEFPALSAKFGFVVDCDGPRQLSAAPGDIRIETSESGGIIVRADGSDLGQPVSEDTAVEAALALARWFTDTKARDVRRMRTHLATTPLPAHFAQQTFAEAAVPLSPGPLGETFAYGVPFGSCHANALKALMDKSAARWMRIAPNRVFILDGAPFTDTPDFITVADDPLMQTHACPGAPGCTQAHAETRTLARALAGQLPMGRTLHVSGCAKGCAHPHMADHTLIAAPGGFDLVLGGMPWDAPLKRGLTAPTLKDIQT